MTSKKPSSVSQSKKNTADKFPYPIRDWTRKEAYPLANSFDKDPFNPPDDADSSWPGKRWAWEFLRRNQDYQRIVAEHPDIALRSKELHQQGRPIEAVEIVEGEPPPLEVALDALFGLPILIDPMRDDPHAFELSYFVRQGWAAAALPHFEQQLAHLTRIARPETVLIEYDLSKPLAPQLKQTEARFSPMFSALSSTGDIKAQHRRKRFDRYPRYIRILDAKNAGAKNRGIAALLYSPIKSTKYIDKYYAGEGNLEKDLKAARALVNGGYRTIPT